MKTKKTTGTIFLKPIRWAQYIIDHGHSADVRRDGTVAATCQVKLPNGTLTNETTTLRTFREVRAWLGY